MQSILRIVILFSLAVVLCLSTACQGAFTSLSPQGSPTSGVLTPEVSSTQDLTQTAASAGSLAASESQTLTPAPSGVVGDGTPESCRESALRAALMVGGDITFNCGSNPVVISFDSPKIISLNADIDGGGLVTLSGNGVTRVFTVTAGIHFGLSNLTIQEGSAFNGGAIYNSGVLNIINTQFVNNTAVGDGGAIFNAPSGVLTISNSSFLTNAAGDDGGGIATEGTAILNHSSFSGNTAMDSGGGIRNGGGKLTVINSIFSSNAAAGATSGDGGGIANDGTLSLTSIQFTNNTADLDGGALFNAVTGTVTIKNSSFVTNMANDDGGAIASDGATSLASILIEGNTSKDKGGGIRVSSGIVTLTNSTISGNTSYEAGSALHVSGGEITISQGTIYSNTSETGGSSLYNLGKLTMFNSLIGGSASGLNCFNDAGGHFIGEGHNLDTDGSCAALSPAFTKVTPEALKLGPLLDHGGGTLTYALQAESAAINAGSNTGCPPTDQRGAPRSDGLCDIGAYEFS